MKKHRVLLLTLLVLLLVVGIPAGLLMREYRREQLHQALIAAVRASDARAASAALKAGADPNAPDTNDKSLTFQERFQHYLDRLRHPDAKPDPSPSPLMLAFESNSWPGGIAPDNPELVQVLLDHGANPNEQIWGGTTPLMCAAYNGYDDCIRLLLAHHADLNARDEEGQTVLVYALLLHGRPETIRLLLQYGMDPNAQDKDGNTAMMFVHDAKSAAVQALIDGHADVNHRNKRGNTALDAVRSAKRMFQRWLNNMKRIQPQNNAHRSDTEARLMNANAAEQILLKAGAKTGKELSAAP